MKLLTCPFLLMFETFLTWSTLKRKLGTPRPLQEHLSTPPLEEHLCTYALRHLGSRDTRRLKVLEQLGTWALEHLSGTWALSHSGTLFSRLIRKSISAVLQALKTFFLYEFKFTQSQNEKNCWLFIALLTIVYLS